MAKQDQIDSMMRNFRREVKFADAARGPVHAPPEYMTRGRAETNRSQTSCGWCREVRSRFRFMEALGGWRGRIRAWPNDMTDRTTS